MKVILLQDIANIGRKFEVADVADGYALNYLIPNGKAKHANKGAIKEIEHKKESEEKEMKERQEKTMKAIESLSSKNIVIRSKANEEGHLFAKVDVDDIREALENGAGLQIRNEDILIDDPIKELGEYKIRIKIGEEEKEIGIEVKEDK